jgi:hypothetical protein
MPKVLLAISGILLVLIFFIVQPIIRIIHRRKNSETIMILNHKTSNSRRKLLLILYKRLSGLFITKKYIQRVTKKYEILYNVDLKEIQIKSIIYVLYVWGINLIILCLFFIRRPSIYAAALTLFYAWFFTREKTFSEVWRAENKILKQLDAFLGDIRYFYYIKGSVEDAIQLSTDIAGKEMKIHAQKIYEILIMSAEERQEQIPKYNTSFNNDYLKMFMAQNVAVVDHGDKIVDDQSVYLSNILYMKDNINAEIRKQDLILSQFRFLSFLITIPLLSMEPIREWALSIFPELHDFYYGQNGLIQMAAWFLWTLVLYYMLGYLKENQTITLKKHDYLEAISKIKPVKMLLNNYMIKNHGKMEVLRITLKRMGENITPKQLMVKRLLFAVAAISFGTLLFVNIHIIDRNNILNEVNSKSVLNHSIDSRQTVVMIETMKEYIEKLSRQRNVLQEQIESELIDKKIFRNDAIASDVAKDIFNRWTRYQNEYLKFYEVVVILIFGYMAYFFPYWMLLFRNSILTINMNEEVMRFQSIILMLRNLDRMTVPIMLEYMELFAVIFKNSIRTCINEFDKGDIEALERLRDSESFIPFQRLIDSFIVSDKIGIEKAFDQVAVERNNMLEKRKQDNDIKIRDKGAVANFIVFVHLCLFIIIYLAVPIVMESMSKLSAYNNKIGPV